ncbi:hypothetical protein Moror_10455 [Moniliophthora roreri MCA 2997]|uniref:Uncharacterized protein n=2 Tax=Moniliophthora roreri TaxID=221103 RepID=V2YJM6_MONRO|nr:hypothetical protein Moror_10455 [Moniliophthora roreri MCA 2997]KAI3605022.1 hypothetical protein WG66_001986 [Moniliophthora roreri]
MSTLIQRVKAKISQIKDRKNRKKKGEDKNPITIQPVPKEPSVVPAPFDVPGPVVPDPSQLEQPLSREELHARQEELNAKKPEQGSGPQ